MVLIRVKDAMRLGFLCTFFNDLANLNGILLLK